MLSSSVSITAQFSYHWRQVNARMRSTEWMNEVSRLLKLNQHFAAARLRRARVLLGNGATWLARETLRLCLRLTSMMMGTYSWWSPSSESNCRGGTNHEVYRMWQHNEKKGK